MSSRDRKDLVTKDERSCSLRTREILELAGRNPGSWIRLGQDQVTLAAVAALQARGAIEIDELRSQFRLCKVA